jgi:excisionase family DNA binding protein
MANTPPTVDPLPLLPTAEVATFLGVTAKTVHNLITTKALPGVRVGSRWKVAPADLDRYVRRNRTTDL